MHTAYTHQWRANPELASYAMASCHSIEEAREAADKAFRAFIALESEAFDSFMKDPPKGFTPCPHPLFGTTCENCGLCNGKKGPDDKRAHVVLKEH